MLDVDKRNEGAGKDRVIYHGGDKDGNSDGKGCWNEERGMRGRGRIIRDDKKCEQRLAP